MRPDDVFRLHPNPETRNPKPVFLGNAMLTIDQLNSHFSLPGVARFDEGKRDMPRLVITTAAAEAHIYLHGAHLTHFQPRGSKPLLFLSSRSNFDAGKPIRDGVPLI